MSNYNKITVYLSAFTELDPYFGCLCLNRESAVSFPQLWCDDRWRLLHGVLRSWLLLWSQKSLSGERQMCYPLTEWDESYSHSASRKPLYQHLCCVLSVAFSMFKPPGTRRYSSSDPQSEGSGHFSILSQSTGDEQRGDQHWLRDTKLLDWYNLSSWSS